MRVVSLERDTPTGHPFHPYQTLSNYLKQYGSIACTIFQLEGDNYITETVRVVSLPRDKPTVPPLHSYQILSKYVKGYQSYEAHKDASTNGRTDAMLIGISPEPIDRGIKTESLIISIKLNKPVHLPLNKPVHLPLNMGNSRTKEVNEHKHLGLVFTSDLLLQSHISY